MMRSPRHLAPLPAGRTGATLTEVLMALLIMSIGIVSVITMFPIAVLRSIQATQLTNSRMMTQNTEQAFRTRFRDPLPTAIYRHTDAYDILNYHLNPAVVTATEAANSAAQFRGVWQPGTLYHPGHIVTASPSKGSYVAEPGHWMICRGTDANNPGFVGAPGYSGSVEPRWNVGVPYQDDMTSRTADGNIYWSAWYDPTLRPATRRAGGPGSYPSVVPLIDQYTSAAATYYGSLNYVLDPLGWATFADVGNYPSVFDNSAATTTPSPNDFGYRYFKSLGLAQAAGTRPIVGTASNALAPFLLRINGGADTIAEAEALATHPDSWTVEIRPTSLENLPVPPVPPPYPGLTAAQFPIGTDLSAITPGDCRIILSSLISKETYVRDITAANANTRIVGWTEPLPYHFIPDGQARIERRDRRFTWMATVNRDFAGHSRVTVVTFFKRGFKPEEEHVYSANFGNDGTVPGLPVPPAPYAITGGDQIRINWTVAGPTAEPDPLIREGNYVFDGRHAAWYRIVAVSFPAAGSALITVDHPVPRAQRTNFTTGPSPGRCILMRGIVELFEITL